MFTHKIRAPLPCASASILAATVALEQDQVADQGEEKNQPKKIQSGATHSLEKWAKRQDQVLENLLRHHPARTRQKAVEQLKTAGFHQPAFRSR